MAYLEIFWTFLKLGCTSFGGPVAHLMYFRKAFVEQRHWLNEQEYSNIVALCHTLPGPASSQVGFSIGLKRGGIFGAILAFVSFTSPSVLLLIIFANYLYMFETLYGQAMLQGLAILAFAVVLQGVLGMGKNLCFDKPRFFVALLTFITMLLMASVYAQVAVIFIGAAIGFFTFSSIPTANTESGNITAPSVKFKLNTRLTTLVCLLAFALLFVVLPFISVSANAFYRTGALVFGGGHVVLPLLEEAMVGAAYVSQADFLAGYGATQAMPGPMFSFAAYLGFLQDNTHSSGGILGALLATVFIFLPGFLLVIAILPFWQRLSAIPQLTQAIAGANAAVVGLLAAALYNPIFIHAIVAPIDLAIAALAFATLTRFNTPVLLVVLGCVFSKAGLVFF
jgi:chromate transporter